VKEVGRIAGGGEHTSKKIARKNIEGKKKGRNTLEMIHLCRINLIRGAKKFGQWGRNSGPKGGISPPRNFWYQGRKFRPVEKTTK
jgi:hypothetical protein